MGATLTLWRFRDGKAGHERQTAGLIAALGGHRTLAVHDIDVSRCHGFADWLRGVFPAAPASGHPDFLIGAGRTCQWPMLAARRAYGGRAIYCMKPALPARCFDLCFVPQHDGARRTAKVEPTFGVLNDLVPRAADQTGEAVLVLVGGPSRHHDWDEEGLLSRIETLLARQNVPVILSDSRRTPESTRTRLAGLTHPRVSFLRSAGLDSSGLPEALATAREVWVSEDSVSMIFEALTAGCPVGVLPVPARRQDRITRLASLLVHGGQVTDYAAWLGGETLRPPSPPLAEAVRCAEVLLERFG